MQKVIHRASERGVAEHEWLHSRFSFSFADWYEPTRMGFGALRVINDDVIDPSSGFGMHPHRDMEIITIVMEGAVTHEDSMGNKGVVRAGEVQVMSAGSGVVHAEYNESPDTALKLFQIWIMTQSRIAPRYAQHQFGTQASPEKVLVGPLLSSVPLTINQNAHITRILVRAGASHEYHLKDAGCGVYLFIIEGSGTVADVRVQRRDAVGVWEADMAHIDANTDLELLCIEVPMQ
jgi:redox-sensitive bicupin YhaK (pirin superfamily)